MSHIVYIISDINKALAFEWISSNLDSSRFKLSFILLNPAGSALEAFLIDRKVPVWRVKCSTKKDWPLAFWQLYRLLRLLRPSTVHCHLRTATLLGLTAAKLLGIPSRIYTRHHSDYHHRYFPGGVKWDKFCNTLATCIIAPSRAVYEILVNSENVPPQKIIIIHHGFDLEYFRNPDDKEVSALRKKYSVEDKFPVIGVISRFTELKGVQFIIPAFQRLLKTYPNSKILLFNAQGDYEEQILRMLEDIPSASYQLITFENDLASAYQLMDLFVQVSTDNNIEAFGQTYVEALAAGIPSVFTLSGIANDFIVDGRNAIVVPFENGDAIYDAIIRIVEEPLLRASLQAEGWNSVKHRFALPEMINQLAKLYDRK